LNGLWPIIALLASLDGNQLNSGGGYGKSQGAH
jgi:hypothetical protein